MSGQYPPLDCAEFKRILKSFGFVPEPQKGTSHEQWVAQNPYRKVTVDCPKAPFTGTLLRLMLAQAQISKKDFYAKR